MTNRHGGFRNLYETTLAVQTLTLEIIDTNWITNTGVNQVATVGGLVLI